MPVSPQGHLKRFLDIYHRTAHVQQDPVRTGPGHPQPVPLREGDDFLIILFCRAESFRELFRRKILMIIGAGRVVELLDEFGQRFLVPQGQPDGQMQTFCG